MLFKKFRQPGVYLEPQGSHETNPFSKKDLLSESTKKVILDLSYPKILVKYFDKSLPEISKINGDWVDLYSRNDVEFKKGDLINIPLNIAIKLPSGYEAMLRPRSSTARKVGLIHASSGVIDNNYSGNNDEWHFCGFAIRDGKVLKGQRIAQFRTFLSASFNFVVVEDLGEEDRGGFGSTGTY